LLIRGSGVLARAGALDPEQAEILRGELDRVNGGGGETKGGSGGTPGGEDVVGEIADILEDSIKASVAPPRGPTGSGGGGSCPSIVPTAYGFVSVS
jgi:hypothetical protein